MIVPLGRFGAPLCAVLAVAWWVRRRMRSPPHRPDRYATREVHAVLLGGALGANAIGWLLQFVPGLQARLEPPYLVGLAIWTVPWMAAAITSIVDGATDRRARIAVAFALTAVIGTSQVADVDAWLRPRSPAPQIADAIGRAGRSGDLILIMPPAHASSFNFYYDGELEQWAPPFQSRITNMPWAGLLARLEDRETMAEFVAALDDRLRRGGRIWVISGGARSLTLDAADDERRDRSTPYARALATARRLLLQVLYQYAQPVPVTAGAASDYWEPIEAALFDPAAGRQDGSGRAAAR
jgi:hypothetical protein